MNSLLRWNYYHRGTLHEDKGAGFAIHLNHVVVLQVRKGKRNLFHDLVSADRIEHVLNIQLQNYPVGIRFQSETYMMHYQLCTTFRRHTMLNGTENFSKLFLFCKRTVLAVSRRIDSPMAMGLISVLATIFLPTLNMTSLMTLSNVDVDIFGNDIIKLLHLFSSCIRIRCNITQTDRQIIQ